MSSSSNCCSDDFSKFWDDLLAMAYGVMEDVMKECEAAFDRLKNETRVNLMDIMEEAERKLQDIRGYILKNITENPARVEQKVFKKQVAQSIDKVEQETLADFSQTINEGKNNALKLFKQLQNMIADEFKQQYQKFLTDVNVYLEDYMQECAQAFKKTIAKFKFECEGYTSGITK